MKTPRHAIPTFDEFWHGVEKKAAKRGTEAVEHLEDVRAAFRLARELARARKEKGLSQMAVAKVTGIDQADISRYERAQGNPGFLTLSKLGKVYGGLTVTFGRAPGTQVKGTKNRKRGAGTARYALAARTGLAASPRG